jgi:uncharacterized metal-binding protein YceD (DUF177 family)
MKIHRKQIPAGGLHVAGEEDCLVPDLEADGICCAGPLTYDLELGLSAGALWANGSLSQPVELRCVSCLEKFVHEVKVPAFALHAEFHGPETVDLTPHMREDVLLNMPAHPHCDRDGGRICKGAKSEKDADLTEQQREAKREHDWEMLDKLRPKLKG